MFPSDCVCSDWTFQTKFLPPFSSPHCHCDDQLSEGRTFVLCVSDVKAGAMNVSDVDIHSVTGVLKLYLRELPEPLFTEASYSNFMDALSQCHRNVIVIVLFLL